MILKIKKVNPTWTTSPDKIIHELLEDSCWERVIGHLEHAARLEMAASIVKEYFRGMEFKGLVFQDWEWEDEENDSKNM